LDNRENLYNLQRAYYALVTYVDRKVGELLQALDDYGLRDNTLIIFISDHGDMLGERRMIQKRSFYEYSAQVPWIISYPKRWQSGIKIKEPVSLIDLMPTILDFVGVDEERILPIDGRSVIPLLEGESEPERYVFSELHAEGVNTTCFMVRQGDFKYIHVTGYEPQLYNLIEDPQEWNNLACHPEYKGIQNKLHDLIMTHFNPEAIEQDVRDRIAQRQIIKGAMQITGTKWDYQPFFDATKQYWREG
jgi:choline-sulfatase